MTRRERWCPTCAIFVAEDRDACPRCAGALERRVLTHPEDVFEAPARNEPRRQPAATPGDTLQHGILLLLILHAVAASVGIAMWGWRPWLWVAVSVLEWLYVLPAYIVLFALGKPESARGLAIGAVLTVGLCFAAMALGALLVP